MLKYATDILLIFSINIINTIIGDSKKEDHEVL